MPKLNAARNARQSRIHVRGGHRQVGALALLVIVAHVFGLSWLAQLTALLAVLFAAATFMEYVNAVKWERKQNDLGRPKQPN